MKIKYATLIYCKIEAIVFFLRGIQIHFLRKYLLQFYSQICNQIVVARPLMEMLKCNPRNSIGNYRIDVGIVVQRRLYCHDVL